MTKKTTTELSLSEKLSKIILQNEEILLQNADILEAQEEILNKLSDMRYPTSGYGVELVDYDE